MAEAPDREIAQKYKEFIDATPSEQLRQLNVMVASHAPESVLLTQAQAIKERLNESWKEIVQVGQATDSLMAVYAPTQEWQPCLASLAIRDVRNTGSRTAKPAGTGKASDKALILKIAGELGREAPTVTSEAVAAALVSEGDHRPPRVIRTSVGNTLAHNGWKKVRPGEYARASS